MLALILEVAGLRLAMEAGAVIEVLPRVTLATLPGGAEGAGAFVYRGEATMVVDVGVLLGAGPASGTLRNRIIVVANPAAPPRAVGLLVEAVLEARRLELGGIGAGAEGIIVDGERMLPLLDWRSAVGAGARSRTP